MKLTIFLALWVNVVSTINGASFHPTTGYELAVNSAGTFTAATAVSAAPYHSSPNGHDKTKSTGFANSKADGARIPYGSPAAAPDTIKTLQSDPLNPPKKPSAGTLRDIVLERLERYAIFLVECIPAAFIAGSALFVTWYLYTYTRMDVLPAFAAIAAIDFVVTLKNPGTSTPTRAVVIGSYSLFHLAYCRLRTLQLRLGKGFVVAATTASVVVFTTLSMIPKLGSIWTSLTGMPGISAFPPIHLIVFILCALAAEIIEKYMKDEQERRETLPRTNQDVQASTNTAREETEEARRRVAPNDNTVPYI